MQAILLAGGLGTRLRKVVSDRPKPMALVEGKPFLQHLIEVLKKNQITDIIFAVGYKGSMIEEYFGDGSQFGFQASYAYEEEQLGTAGAIKNCTSLLKEDSFYVLNADTFYDLDYSRLAKLSENNDAVMSLVLRTVPDCSRYGTVKINGNKVEAFNEKSTEAKEGLINGGVYLMRKSLLDEIPQGKVSLENEMIPKWLEKGYTISAIVNDGYFIDIGIPEDYFRFQQDVKEGRVITL